MTQMRHYAARWGTTNIGIAIENPHTFEHRLPITEMAAS